MTKLNRKTKTFRDIYHNLIWNNICDQIWHNVLICAHYLDGTLTLYKITCELLDNVKTEQFYRKNSLGIWAIIKVLPKKYDNKDLNRNV